LRHLEINERQRLHGDDTQAPGTELPRPAQQARQHALRQGARLVRGPVPRWRRWPVFINKFLDKFQGPDTDSLAWLDANPLLLRNKIDASQFNALAERHPAGMREWTAASGSGPYYIIMEFMFRSHLPRELDQEVADKIKENADFKLHSKYRYEFVLTTATKEARLLCKLATRHAIAAPSRRNNNPPAPPPPPPALPQQQKQHQPQQQQRQQPQTKLPFGGHTVDDAMVGPLQESQREDGDDGYGWRFHTLDKYDQYRAYCMFHNRCLRGDGKYHFGSNYVIKGAPRHASTASRRSVRWRARAQGALNLPRWPNMRFFHRLARKHAKHTPPFSQNRDARSLKMTATNRQACAMLLLLLAAASLGLAAAGSGDAPYVEGSTRGSPLQYDCSVTLASDALTCTADAASLCTVTLPDALALDAPDAKYVTCVTYFEFTPFASFASLLAATSTPFEPVAEACNDSNAVLYSDDKCRSAILSQVRTTTAKATQVLTLAFEPIFMKKSDSVFPNGVPSVVVVCAQQSSKNDVCDDAQPSGHAGQQQQGGSYLWGTELPPAPCPPDTAEIGRAAWAVLHSVAAYYPERPTREDREALRGLAHGLARLYPCAECRQHLPSDLAAASPPMRRPGQGGGEGADGDSGADDADGDAASSRAAAERWACKLHNSVNARLDKPAYDCARVGERWRDGWRDGTCGDQQP